MNLNQKQIAAILVIVFALALLTGCGKTTPTVSDDDPNIGLWRATKVEMFGEETDANEIFDGGFELELMSGGKCEFRADGKKDSYAWVVQGNTLTISAGSTDFISATIEDGTMVIGDFMETGMKITLEKEGAATSKPATSAAIDAGYYAIDSMTIGTEHYDAESLSDMGIRYYIRLNEDGTAQISTDMLITGTWKDGKIHYQQDGENVVNPYLLDGDTLTIEIGDDDAAATLVFKRSGEPAEQALWHRDWYGYIWVTEGYGAHKGMEDFFEDAYLVIDIGEAGSGALKIILDGDDENMVEASIVADENHFEVTEGFCWDMPLDPAVWWIALSPVSGGNLFVISDTYIDPQGDGKDGFDYMFCFRPYGEPWDQEEREGDRIPPGYGQLYRDDWTLDGYAGDADAGSNDAAGQVADAAPHFTSAQIKSIYEKLSNAYDDFSLQKLTYEEVRDAYFDGVDGTLDYEGNATTMYKWFAIDNGEIYAMVSFQDKKSDGNKTADGVGSYFP